VCAANKLSSEYGPYLILGIRHWDHTMCRHANDIFKSDVFSNFDWDQGFVDQYGVWMDRLEAWKVAEAAGQILYRCGGDTTNGGTLYSENLY